MKTTNVKDIEIIELPTNWPVGPVNVFLIKGEKLTLVDAGRKLPKAWDIFRDSLREKGFSVNDIEQIVLTHHHTDHTGLLGNILKDNPIPVYGHPNCRPFLTLNNDYFLQSKKFFTKFFRENGVPEHFIEKLANRRESRKDFDKVNDFIEINEGSNIPGLSDWQVIETLGHSQTHLSFYRPQDKVFLSGDHLIKHLPAGLYIDAPFHSEKERPKPLLQYLENLQKVLRFPISVTLSSHGESIEDTKQFILQTMEKIEKRAKKIKSVTSIDGKTAYQIMEALHPTNHLLNIPGLLSDIVAFLDLLVDRGEINAEENNGVIFYSLNKG